MSDRARVERACRTFDELPLRLQKCILVLARLKTKFFTIHSCLKTSGELEKFGIPFKIEASEKILPQAYA